MRRTLGFRPRAGRVRVRLGVSARALRAPAHRMAAIVAAVVVLWVCETLPMAVTAALGPVLAILFSGRAGAPGARAVRRPGHLPLHRRLHARRGDVRARSRSACGLHRALVAPRRHERGARAHRLRRGDDIISMWISNVGDDGDDVSDRARDRRRTCRRRAAGPRRGRAAAMRASPLAMMLITSFGASVGGMATPVGTPPNLIGIGLIERVGGRHISFFEWTAIGLPAARSCCSAFIAAMFAWTSARGPVALARRQRRRAARSWRSSGGSPAASATCSSPSASP